MWEVKRGQVTPADRAHLRSWLARAVRAAVPGRERIRVRRERRDSSQAISGSSDWTCCEITAQVPAGAETVGFELTLVGPGKVRLPHLELARTS